MEREKLLQKRYGELQDEIRRRHEIIEKEQNIENNAIIPENIENENVSQTTEIEDETQVINNFTEV